jgi:hypothetical protein
MSSRTPSQHAQSLRALSFAKEGRILSDQIKRAEYEDAPATCKWCNLPFAYENSHGVGAPRKIFCNSSCAAKYNNHGRKKVKKVERQLATQPALKSGNGKPFGGSTPSSTAKKCGCGRTTRSERCVVCVRKERRVDFARRWAAGQTSQIADYMLRRHQEIRELLMHRQDGKCAICGIPEWWNNKPLRFVVDHIDGHSENSGEANIRLVCRNCDSQLPTFGSRNRGHGRLSCKLYARRMVRFVKDLEGSHNGSAPASNTGEPSLAA